MNNCFYNANNRYIYSGNKESASPIREARRLCTEAEAKAIDRQEARIRQLERERRAANNR